MATKAKVDKRFFAQVGMELMEFPADAVGQQLSTSAPVRFYRVRASVDGQTFMADADSFKDAEADVDKQIKAATT